MSQRAPVPQLVDEHGKPIPLGADIGTGGEGIVYEIVGNPDQVAKVYHPEQLEGAQGARRAEKVRYLASICDAALQKSMAWPERTIHAPNGKFVGFTMSRLPRNYNLVLKLWALKSRRDLFPQADWRFQIRTAANIARIFALLHEKDIVIGDINERGILVGPEATVRFLDCDSFQVKSPQTTFLCTVGSLEWNPPELKDFSRERTSNHDNYGLALLVFRLMFQARNPFSGVYQGTGEAPTADRCVKEFRYAYGPDHSRTQMRPPPNSLDPVAVGPAAALFVRAFSPDSPKQGRPAAREWLSALTTLEKSLINCGRNSAHQHLPDTPCPWCILPTPFFTKSPTSSVLLIGIDDVVAWLRGSSPMTAAPPLTVATPPPSQAVTQLLQSKSKELMWGILGNACVGILAAALVDPICGVGVFVLSASIFAAVQNALSKKALPPEDIKLKDEAEQAHRTWMRADPASFNAKLAEAWSVHDELKKLPDRARQRQLVAEADLETKRRNEFLDRYSIQDATIRNLTRQRKIDLLANQVETALDITERSISGISGIGPATRQSLLDWRDQIASQFRFNRAEGLTPQDKAALQTAARNDQNQIHTQLRVAVGRAQALHEDLLRVRAERPRMEAVVNAWHACEADREALAKRGQRLPLKLTSLVGIFLLLVSFARSGHHDAPAPIAAAAAPASAPVAPAPQSPVTTSQALLGKVDGVVMLSVLADKLEDADQLKTLARDNCPGEEGCTVQFYVGLPEAPADPAHLTSQQRRALGAKYERRPGAQHGRLRLSCKWRQDSDCFKP